MIGQVERVAVTDVHRTALPGINPEPCDVIYWIACAKGGVLNSLPDINRAAIFRHDLETALRKDQETAAHLHLVRQIQYQSFRGATVTGISCETVRPVRGGSHAVMQN